MKAILKVIQLHKNNTTLIKKAAKNNREAQQVLFDTHAPKMLSVCRYYLKDFQKAEEVMLNGFLKAFTHLKQFQDFGSFEGWLRKIMVREAISYLRQAKKIEFPVDVTESEWYHDSYNNIHSNMNVDQIQQLIDQLPDGYKIVFVMYAIEGYKHHEIANMLNISEGTSKSQLFKARKQLQQALHVFNTTHYGTK
ncbi:RNA polymerase sigma-70 factor, ECF subfamily [Bizionia echini]|uniref:RNA polymerase sigma-70 factor, ECF subfamily n=1 Tax=Bizionia echini TaxID=649333 RepID=A0A1I4ZXR1_9FLAO|nr:RNA polymerase sigma factor [Bizionia echini]SFN54985.1 RNA polymerase sigma-70 factor, ECF subfamily [Bizionia echini]